MHIPLHEDSIANITVFIFYFFGKLGVTFILKY